MSRNDDGRDPGPRGRPRDARVDDAILDAALTLFARGGQGAVTFDGVATGAGVSRSAVYRRWGSSDEMIVAALARHRTRGERGAEGWESATSVAEVMTLFAERAVHTLTDPRDLALLAQVQALDPDSPVKHEYWTAIVQPRRRAFTAMIRSARGRGELAPGPDPDLVLDLLAGALSYRALSRPDALDDDGARRYVHALLDALGLAADPGE